jgi:phosphonate transport system ATP-binding protein
VDEPLSALDPARSEQAIATLTEVAREAGASLVTTLHDVPVALANFPRIVGMREGAIVFDLPSAAVTPERLQALYDQHLDELSGGPRAPQEERPAALAARIAMACR